MQMWCMFQTTTCSSLSPLPLLFSSSLLSLGSSGPSCLQDLSSLYMLFFYGHASFQCVLSVTRHTNAPHLHLIRNSTWPGVSITRHTAACSFKTRSGVVDGLIRTTEAHLVGLVIQEHRYQGVKAPWRGLNRRICNWYGQLSFRLSRCT